MSLHRINVAVELTEINCGECGGTYAINEKYRKTKYENGGTWNCPYCQVGWGYSKNNENSILKRKLEKEEQRRRWAEQAEIDRRDELLKIQKKLSAQKGATTRLKNRMKAGVCPCCTRTFKQLAAHMKNKHPDFSINDR